MKPISFARRRELDREAERIRASFDDKFSDPKQHTFNPWLPESDRCWHCNESKEAHEQEKKS